MAKKKEKPVAKEKRTIVADGLAEDLIRSFVQVGCAESHAKTLLEKATAQLENGIIDLSDSDAVMAQTEKIQQLTEEINSLAELRRGMMLRLFNMYDGDKEYWCMAKHLGVGAYTMFEAYQASDDDPELLQMAMDANKRFINAMSHFIGTEITECASCFGDFLRAGKKGDK